MQHLPRHLLLAAVLLTVCCAERQGNVSLELREAAQLAGQRLAEQAVTSRDARRTMERRQTVRPALAGYALAPAAPRRPAPALCPPEPVTIPRPTLTFDQLRLPPPTV